MPSFLRTRVTMWSRRGAERADVPSGVNENAERPKHSDYVVSDATVAVDIRIRLQHLSPDLCVTLLRANLIGRGDPCDGDRSCSVLTSLPG